jgi:predicted RNase H-like HicB family nuclease
LNPKELIMELSAIVTPATEGGYVAFNPETGTTTQGKTIEESLANLQEATELYLKEFPMIQSGRSLLTTFQVATHV